MKIFAYILMAITLILLIIQLIKCLKASAKAEKEGKRVSNEDVFLSAIYACMMIFFIIFVVLY